MLLAWAATNGYKVRQLDFVGAFLNGDLDEQTYRISGRISSIPKQGKVFARLSGIRVN